MVFLNLNRNYKAFNCDCLVSVSFDIGLNKVFLVSREMLAITIAKIT
jgi:hypothetical protein